MIRVYKDKKACFIDHDGNILLETNFIGASDFFDGLASVYINRKHGFIDESGQVVIEPRYEEAYHFHEGLCAIKEVKKFGFIDKKGTTVIKPQFDGVSFFQENICGIKIGNEWGFIDKTGEIIVTPQYTKVSKFNFGVVGVQREEAGRVDYLNKAGKVIIKEGNWINIVDFYEGLVRSRNHRKKLYGYRNTSGKWAIKALFILTHEFSEGLAGVEVAVGKKVKTGFINKSGEFELSPEYYYDFRPIFKGGLAVVRESDEEDARYGAIDKTGNIVIPYGFQYLTEFSEGIAEYAVGEKFGYVNTKGEIVVSAKYDRVRHFENGVGEASVGNSEYLINKNGKIIWEYHY